ncbi:MAG: DUF3367 domain-containing protein, partial [Candidatus Levybacteria bacterium]|nr:DUF3367 domain-containing protein [Candidatus Levybacteria bacterium]
MSRSTKILTVFVFLLSLIPLLWFPGKTILLGYDNVYPLSPLPFLYDRMHSWSWIIGFGSDQSAIQGSLIIHIIDVLPQFLGFSHQASQKIVFSLWFFLLLASPFILATRLEHYGFVRSPFVRYFFPILYAVNFYTLQAWWIAERTKFSLMVATPLILAVILPLLQRRSLRTAILCGLLCALILSVFNGGGWAGFSLYGGLVAILFSFILFTTVQALMTREYKTILSIVLFFLVFGFFYLLLNAYTILPFLAVTLSEYDALISRSGGITSLVGWTRYLSENTSFINLMRLQAMPDWYNTAFHPYSSSYLRNPFLIGASFLFSIGLFAPFFFKRQITNGILVYFLLVLIVSLFLSAGSHKPFGSLFEFLMRNVPGFLVFRSAIFKFGYAFWLAAGFFISLTLSEITVRLSQRLTIIKGSVQVRQVGFVSLFISIIVLYHYPFLTGNFFQINKQPVMSRVSLPPYVASFAAWWKENGKDERILLLPRLSSNWYFELYTWSYLSLNPILANFGSKGIVENTVLLSPSEKSHLDALYQAIREGDDERMRLLSSMLGIQYLLLRKDFFHDYPGIETDNPFDLKKQLVSPLLEKEATFGEWDVYRFRESHQLFTTQTTAIASDNPADIHYELLDQRS